MMAQRTTPQSDPTQGRSADGDVCIPYIAWEIQLTCNMGCEFCYSSSYNRFNRRETRDRLSLEQIEGGITALRAARLGIDAINWSGGEPLLRHGDLPAIVRASARAGFRNILSTNGMFSVFPEIGHRTDRNESDRRFRKYLVEGLAPHLEWLSLSWDSADRHVNNAVMRLAAGRKKASRHHYDDVLSVVRMYRELGPPFRLKVNTLVSQKNHRSGVLEIGEHLRGLDVVWKLIQFNPRECPEEFREEHLLSTSAFEAVLDEARARYGGQEGFDGLRISSRFYDGAGEPYCFLVINTSGQILLPKGEAHVALARLYGPDGHARLPERVREEVLQRLTEEVAGTETYRLSSGGGALSPLQVFCDRNRDILEGSYSLDPFEFEPFRVY